MSLYSQSKLHAFGVALNNALPDIVYHYERPAGVFPVLIWQEDFEATSFNSDNIKAEQAMHGTIDYFTKQEYDPAIDTVQETLVSVGCSWRVNSVQYEDETGLIHYEWEFEVR